MELPDRCRPTDYQAFETLSDLHVRKISSRRRLRDWEAARDMLRDLYTRDQSCKGSAECAKRIEYLRVTEPVPMMEDFYPGDAPPMPTAKCGLILDLVQRQFETSRAGYPTREEVRKKELEWALDLLEDQEAAEAARKWTPWIAGDAQSDPGVGAGEDSSFLVAEIAETPEQLERLFHDRHRHWEFVGFVSVLVQRTNAVQHLVDEHRHLHPRPSGRKVTDARDLERLVNETESEVHRLAECLVCYMRSAPFQRLFRDRDDYEEPTLRDVTSAAAAVVHFYTANLLLARTVRDVSAGAEFVVIVEDTAHLVDRSLEGVDQWITKLVGFAAILPTLERSGSAHQREAHALVLDLEFDDALVNRIHRQLDAVPGALSDAAYIRKWEGAFKKSGVARASGDGSIRKRELGPRIPVRFLTFVAVLIPVLGVQLVWNGFADWMWNNVLVYGVVAYLIYGLWKVVNGDWGPYR